MTVDLVLLRRKRARFVRHTIWTRS